ncbi:MAG: DUF6788 family protein [Candidatus Dormiibacterota bacterium]
MESPGDRGLAGLEAERMRLQGQLAEVGDFRRGSLTATYRRCGKPHCACAVPGHPGHGPIHLLSKSVEGKTATRAVPPGPALEKTRREVESYKRFRAVVEQIVEVNEQICDARQLADAQEAAPDGQRGAL